MKEPDIGSGQKKKVFKTKNLHFRERHQIPGSSPQTISHEDHQKLSGLKRRQKVKRENSKAQQSRVIGHSVSSLCPLLSQGFSQTPTTSLLHT